MFNLLKVKFVEKDTEKLVSLIKAKVEETFKNKKGSFQLKILMLLKDNYLHTKFLKESLLCELKVFIKIIRGLQIKPRNTIGVKIFKVKFLYFFLCVM